MSQHPNARLTPRGRETLVSWVAGGGRVSDVSRQMGVSRQTASKWLARARAFLLAAMRKSGRFSIVTTKPNTSVASVHDRMPLVLGPGESSMWLGPDSARLEDKSSVTLIGVSKQGTGGAKYSLKRMKDSRDTLRVFCLLW